MLGLFLMLHLFTDSLFTLSLFGVTVMAYISTNEVAAIRAKLKAEFPEMKFSVRRENHMKVCVAILKAPYHFIKDQFREKMQGGYNWQVNHHWVDHHECYQHVDKLKRIIRICNEGNHDNSDIMTDYFDVGWYFDLEIGKYDKDFQYTGA
jgi:hypothetical protein